MPKSETLYSTVQCQIFIYLYLIYGMHSHHSSVIIIILSPEVKLSDLWTLGLLPGGFSFKGQRHYLRLSFGLLLKKRFEPCGGKFEGRSYFRGMSWPSLDGEDTHY
uniref:Uncharacterized protein LOC104223310 isoform X2 n=1 Tax=Nicotiana sylvestris TaxID=4096 RepID=A0A1U7W749_NICSY|nr:PREDICTED: uncharacterized protein LOC104223310 isoform X2 [Nicotiana sylvestris]